MASAAKSAANTKAATAAKSNAKPAAKSSAKPAAKPAKAASGKGQSGNGQSGNGKTGNGQSGNGKSAPAKAPKAASPAKADPKAVMQEPAKASKSAAPAKAKDAAAKPEVGAKPAKPKKQKLVRDSFTMPESEYALLGEVKKACLANGYAVKKSELLRVGVALIRTLDNASLKNWIDSLPPLKPGRPRKEKQGA